MESDNTNTINEDHLQKVRDDIESDKAKMDELDKRIKGRTILGIALPGVTALKEERHRVEMAWRFSLAEESSTMTEISQDRLHTVLAEAKTADGDTLENIQDQNTPENS